MGVSLEACITSYFSRGSQFMLPLYAYPCDAYLYLSCQYSCLGSTTTISRSPDVPRSSPNAISDVRHHQLSPRARAHIFSPVVAGLMTPLPPLEASPALRGPPSRVLLSNKHASIAGGLLRGAIPLLCRMDSDRQNCHRGGSTGEGDRTPNGGYMSRPTTPQCNKCYWPLYYRVAWPEARFKAAAMEGY